MSANGGFLDLQHGRDIKWLAKQSKANEGEHKSTLTATRPSNTKLCSPTVIPLASPAKKTRSLYWASGDLMTLCMEGASHHIYSEH